MEIDSRGVGGITVKWRKLAATAVFVKASHLITFRWRKETGWWIVPSSLQIAESKLQSGIRDNEAKFQLEER